MTKRKYFSWTDEKRAELKEFINTHDLSKGVEGAWPEPLILLKQGEKMLASTTKYTWLLDFDKTINTLENFANYIVSLVRTINNEWSREICQRWENRLEKPKERT